MEPSQLAEIAQELARFMAAIGQSLGDLERKAEDALDELEDSARIEPGLAAAADHLREKVLIFAHLEAAFEKSSTVLVRHATHLAETATDTRSALRERGESRREGDSLLIGHRQPEIREREVRNVAKICTCHCHVAGLVHVVDPHAISGPCCDQSGSVIAGRTADRVGTGIKRAGSRNSPPGGPVAGNVSRDRTLVSDSRLGPTTPIGHSLPGRALQHDYRGLLDDVSRSRISSASIVRHAVQTSRFSHDEAAKFRNSWAETNRRKYGLALEKQIEQEAMALKNLKGNFKSRHSDDGLAAILVTRVRNIGAAAKRGRLSLPQAVDAVISEFESSDFVASSPAFERGLRDDSRPYARRIRRRLRRNALEWVRDPGGKLLGSLGARFGRLVGGTQLPFTEEAPDLLRTVGEQVAHALPSLPVFATIQDHTADMLNRLDSSSSYEAGRLLRKVLINGYELESEPPSD